MASFPFSYLYHPGFLIQFFGFSGIDLNFSRAIVLYGSDAYRPSLWKCSSSELPCNSGNLNAIGFVIVVFLPSRSWLLSDNFASFTSSGSSLCPVAPGKTCCCNDSLRYCIPSGLVRGCSGGAALPSPTCAHRTVTGRAIFGTRSIDSGSDSGSGSRTPTCARARKAHNISPAVVFFSSLNTKRFFLCFCTRYWFPLPPAIHQQIPLGGKVALHCAFCLPNRPPDEGTRRSLKKP